MARTTRRRGSDLATNPHGDSGSAIPTGTLSQIPSGARDMAQSGAQDLRLHQVYEGKTWLGSL
jgi:hypothetical protein